MGANTFNVREFNSIYSMLEDSSTKLSTKSNQIVSLCEQLSQLLKSNDSNLSNSYLRIGETLSAAKNKIVMLLEQLKNEMQLYESRTIYFNFNYSK